MMDDFHKARQELLQRHGDGLTGLEFCRAYARLMDEHLKDLFRQASGPDDESQGRVALAALGGYGRRELAPYSDVDLLFLTSRSPKESKPLVESVLYPLWDLKLDVGHAVRTSAECLDMARQDLTIQLSLLDARFLTGDEGLFSEFQGSFRRWFGFQNNKRTFLQNLKKSLEERHQKYGQTPYLLEPNVKEGQGGLRDIQTIIWAGAAFYKQRSFKELAEMGLLPSDRIGHLTEAYAFMTGVRTYLHTLEKKKADVLTFDLQEDVAGFLGFPKNQQASGVERFMQEYYTRVYQIKGVLNFFISRIEEELRPAKLWRLNQRSRTVEKGLLVRRGQIELSGSAEVRRKPLLLMKAFETAMTEGLPISQRGLEIVRSNLDLIDDDYRRDPAAAQSFLRALAAVPRTKEAAPKNLEAMQGVNFLAAYVPELDQVRARVQHDAYHVYTVDVHLVLTLWELKKMAMGLRAAGEDEDAPSVFNQVRDKEILFLAGLLHDLGKGRGRDHAKRGAAMIPEIGTRLGLNPERIENLSFLVAEHLFLIELATRRDLSEEKLIVGCAQKVESVERLNQLYLLSIADAKATGPGAWNQWRASLLRELYFKVLRVLTRSGLAERELSLRHERLLARVRELLAERLAPAEVAAHFEEMSAHYLSVMEAKQIGRHILLERQLRDQPVIWEVEAKEEGFCEVTVLTQDRPGLLSRLAGVFTLHNINILGAQVFTRTNNVALDVFQVSYPPDRLFAEEVWAKVKLDTQRALTGHLALDFRLARKKPLLETRSVGPRRPSRVEIDNETSDFYTIIEVYTHDRLGLLYELTKTLFDLQLSIYIAKISTTVDQVVDVFYARDFFGQKLTDVEQLEEVKAALSFTVNK